MLAVTRSQAKRQVEADRKLKQIEIPTDQQEGIGGDIEEKVSRETCQGSDVDEPCGVLDFADDMFLPMEETNSIDHLTELPHVRWKIQDPRGRILQKFRSQTMTYKKWAKHEDPERIVKKDGIMFRRWRNRN